ncbi:phenylpropionate dioxygenase-like ring-hydroxylating dioxygenase large terminal subunit [Roseovarius sp. MBR-79]
MARDLGDDILQGLRAAAGVPFEEARAMPPEVYVSPDFTALELAHVFARDWYCVGRVDGLAQPGDYLTCDLAGQPVLVLRDRDGSLRAMSNVCLHRMSTLLHGSGNTRAITCPYHGWTYNLDGSLRGAPAMGQNAGFCKEEYRLPRVRCETWLGWVFVTLDPDTPPVAERLADLAAMIADYDMTRYSQSFAEEHVWDTNWKVLAENFMESYHLPVCHAGTIGGLSRLEEMVCPPGHAAFNHHTILKDESLRIACAHPSNTRLEGDARRTTWLLAIYPSLMITLTPGYFWYLSLLPRGPGQVHIRFGGGMSDDFAEDADATENFARLKTLLDAVNVEDRGCTERVYRGLCAPLARPGHLSHLERPNYDFARYLLGRIEAGQGKA